jgi:hypothetical protein
MGFMRVYAHEARLQLELKSILSRIRSVATFHTLTKRVAFFDAYIYNKLNN